MHASQHVQILYNDIIISIYAMLTNSIYINICDVLKNRKRKDNSKGLLELPSHIQTLETKMAIYRFLGPLFLSSL